VPTTSVQCPTRWKVFVPCSALLLLLIVFVYLKYGKCANALAWHCTHGNVATAGGKKVRLPLLWWQEDSGRYDTSLFLRALPPINAPKIVVGPALPGSVGNTDEEELKLTQDVVLSENHSSTGQEHVSVVTVSPKAFALYCVKDEITISPRIAISHLQCNAAGVPYTYTYDGPPEHEKEAEGILSGMD